MMRDTLELIAAIVVGGTVAVTVMWALITVVDVVVGGREEDRS